MSTYEVHFGLVAVVGLNVRHLGLILTNATLCRVILVCLGDSLEVKFVGVTLAVNLRHDVLVVVVTQSTAQLVIVHVGLALALSPALGHLVRVSHFELSIGAFPSDDSNVAAVGQQLQQKLP